MVDDPQWAILCRVLDVPPTATLEEVVVAAEELRAEAEIQLAGIQAAGQWAADVTPTIEAADAVYHELIRLGRYEPDEVEIDKLRSDRWPPEAHLMAVVARRKAKKVVSAG